MLYLVDEVPCSNIVASVVRFLLPLSTMESDRPASTLPPLMDNPPPDPPPPTSPPDSPHSSPALPTTPGPTTSTPFHLTPPPPLLASTKAQVYFLSETRNASITKTAIKNHFNYKDAFVVPVQGQSGGLWLIWNDEVDLNIVNHSHHFIFVLCINKTSLQQYGLVCIYGDPHHHTTSIIWEQVLNFVVDNSNLHVLCMGDMNNLMNVNEKLSPLGLMLDVLMSSAFMLNSVVLLI